MSDLAASSCLKTSDVAGLSFYLKTLKPLGLEARPKDELEGEARSLMLSMTDGLESVSSLP